MKLKVLVKLFMFVFIVITFSSAPIYALLQAVEGCPKE